MQRHIWVRAMVVLAAQTIILSGCAPLATQVAPTIMDPYAYQAATCRELNYMYSRTQRDRIFADIAQNQQYEDDRTRTFGIPTPMASVFEESRAPATAQTKADSLVIKSQLQRSGCMANNNSNPVPVLQY